MVKLCVNFLTVYDLDILNNAVKLLVSVIR